MWSYDFAFDRTEAGRQIKVLALVDEYTHECLCLHASRSITSADAIGILASVMIERGAPEHLRSDNGPEFIAHAVKAWLDSVGTSTLFVEPGAPWENGCIESFNSRLRDELLNGEIFVSLAEARYMLERFAQAYNTESPHSALNYLTPSEVAPCSVPSDSASLRLRAHCTATPSAAAHAP